MKRALRPVVRDPIRDEDDLWLGYDPVEAKEALRQAAGILAGVDTAELKKEIRQSREQDSRARPSG